MAWRNRVITGFVICWTLLFQYETLRANYLSPLLHRPLPKCPLLFPPAGWIMFYTVDPSYGFTEVYAIRGKEPVKLDSHEIFATRAVGYDNIRRNILVSVLSREAAPSFCRYLKRKFPGNDAFAVLYANYPDLIKSPDRVLFQVAYRCD